MMIKKLLVSGIFLLGLSQATLLCAENLSTSTTTNVRVMSSRSIPELERYIDRVDHRLKKGQYDDLNQQKRQWIVDQMAALRSEIEDIGPGGAQTETLKMLASDFETAIIKLEEGDIVCRHEQKTGTRMVTRRCFSRSRQSEEAQRQQDQFRRAKRPQKLPTVT